MKPKIKKIGKTVWSCSEMNNFSQWPSTFASGPTPKEAYSIWKLKYDQLRFNARYGVGNNTGNPYGNCANTIANPLWFLDI